MHLWVITCIGMSREFGVSSCLHSGLFLHFLFMIPCNRPASCRCMFIAGLGRSPGEGNGHPLQCSCLENPMDRGAWWAAVRGVAKSQR